MGLIHRGLRKLGFDTVRTLKEEMTLYRYTVTHVHDDEREVLAHYRRRGKGGFVDFYRYYEDPVIESEAPEPEGEKIRLLFGSLMNRKYKAAELESIKEIEKEKVAKEEFWVEYDQADRIIKDYGYHTLEEYD